MGERIVIVILVLGLLMLVTVFDALTTKEKPYAEVTENRKSEFLLVRGRTYSIDVSDKYFVLRDYDRREVYRVYIATIEGGGFCVNGKSQSGNVKNEEVYFRFIEPIEEEGIDNE